MTPTPLRRKQGHIKLGLFFTVAVASSAGMGGCDGTDTSSVEVVRGAVTATPPPGINGAVTPGLEASPVYQAYIASLARDAITPRSVQGVPETLADYAAACDAATGIHVPAFNCANGTEVPQGTVQTGLTNANIGITGGTRSETISSEGIATETITAGGADIWGTSDQFFFAYKGITGDGYAEIDVTGLTNSHAFAKAGVMFRDGTAANARNVMMAITPTSGAIFQSRLTAGATSTNTILAGRTTPAWLRVVRKGNVFTGFVTTDRVTWTQVGSAVTFSAFSAQALVGIAVTSHNTGATTTATVLQFSWTPDVPYSSSTTCDRPAELTHKCDPGSKFQVIAQSADATAVAHCRRQGNTTANTYSDIAVIQYNKVNGALCFYQALGTMDGSNVPAPSSPPGTGSLTWFTPLQTRQSNCVGCHDNGGFIRSKYLTQLAALPATSVAATLPSYLTGYDNNTPIRYVGADFVYRSWAITANKATGDNGLNCNACHRLAVNDYSALAGTAGNYAIAATASTATSKNPHGPTSPIWMRLGQVTYDALALATATNYKNCASAFANAGFPASPAIAGCSFSQFGEPWQPFFSPTSFNDLNVGISNGTATHNGTVDTVSARGSDIYGTSDQFMYAVQAAPPGNGLATVKVTGLTNTDPFAKAGIMVRNGIGATDENVMINVTPTSGAIFQYRQTLGGSTTSNIVAGVTAPVWLRLVRTGSTFTGWVSSNLVGWTQIGPAVTIPALAAANLVGEAVTSHNTSQSATGNFDYFSWTAATANTLADANIGITGGLRKEMGTTNTITAGGADIYGTSDQFYFAFKSLTGNGTVTAKVTALGNTDPYAKAGLMFRSSAAADAPHAMIDITPGQGAGFQTRSTAGGTTTATFAAGHVAPRWLRIKRVGNAFTGYVSSDGSTFTQVGTTTTISGFSSSALFGLAVTSHNTGAQTTATFTDLGLTVP